MAVQKKMEKKIAAAEKRVEVSVVLDGWRGRRCGGLSARPALAHHKAWEIDTLTDTVMDGERERRGNGLWKPEGTPGTR